MLVVSYTTPAYFNWWNTLDFKKTSRLLSNILSKYKDYMHVN